MYVVSYLQRLVFRYYNINLFYQQVFQADKRNQWNNHPCSLFILQHFILINKLSHHYNFSLLAIVFIYGRFLHKWPCLLKYVPFLLNLVIGCARRYLIIAGSHYLFTTDKGSIKVSTYNICIYLTTLLYGKCNLLTSFIVTMDILQWIH